MHVSQVDVSKLEEKVNKIEKTNSELHALIINLKDAYKNLQDSFLYTLHNIVMTADFRLDQKDYGVSRVPRFCSIIANDFGMSEDEVRYIRDAATTYDVGKIGIPVEILLKPGQLSDEEFDIIKTHTIIGGNLLSNSDDKTFVLARQIALSHHERWNGSGYPIGLVRNKIPLHARIVGLADTFDALISRRPHRDAYTFDSAIDMIRKEKGRLFDPDIVDVFVRSADKFITSKDHLFQK